MLVEPEQLTKRRKLDIFVFLLALYRLVVIRRRDAICFTCEAECALQCTSPMEVDTLELFQFALRKVLIYNSKKEVEDKEDADGHVEDEEQRSRRVVVERRHAYVGVVGSGDGHKHADEGLVKVVEVWVNCARAVVVNTARIIADWPKEVESNLQQVNIREKHVSTRHTER